MLVVKTANGGQNFKLHFSIFEVFSLLSPELHRFSFQDFFLFGCGAKMQLTSSRPPHMGTTFFVGGVKNFFPCVHGSKMAIGEVMFLAAIAWVKRGGRGGKKIFYIKENNCLLLFFFVFSVI